MFPHAPRSLRAGLLLFRLLRSLVERLFSSFCCVSITRPRSCLCLTLTLRLCSRTSLSNGPYRLIAETDKLQNFSELAELSLSFASQISVKSLSDLTGLFTASITSGSSSRLREYGMQLEALPNYEGHEN